MKYIVIHKDEITQNQLDSINKGEITKPSILYIQEPDMESEQPGIESEYMYITTEDEFPNEFSDYKKLSQENFDTIKQRVQSGQTIINKVHSKAPTLQAPFANKEIDGKKIFKRVHGVEIDLQSQNGEVEFEVPYSSCKITGMEIVAGELGDKVDFQVLDTEEGTISGQSKFMLNQFGFDVYVAKDYYEHVSNYDADLFGGMFLKIIYKSNNKNLPRKAYINIILHEVK